MTCFRTLVKTFKSMTSLIDKQPYYKRWKITASMINDHEEMIWLFQ